MQVKERKINPAVAKAGTVIILLFLTSEVGSLKEKNSILVIHIDDISKWIALGLPERIQKLKS